LWAAVGEGDKALNSVLRVLHYALMEILRQLPMDL
jgi:hypothetical protein